MVVHRSLGEVHVDVLLWKLVTSRFDRASSGLITLNSSVGDILHDIKYVGVLSNSMSGLAATVAQSRAVGTAGK